VAVRLPHFSILAGGHHQRTNEIPPSDVPVGPPVRSRDQGHHHLSTQQEPYTKLRTELLDLLSPSGEQRFLQVLTPESMGDRKPSQYLRHLRSLAQNVPDNLLSTIWTSQLPRDIQITLAAQPDVQLDAAACCADRITEAVPGLRSGALTHQPNPSSRSKWRNCHAGWRPSAPSLHRQSPSLQHLGESLQFQRLSIQPQEPSPLHQITL
jgi:hypothetical protein